MKYPKYAEEQDLRRKIYLADIENIKKLSRLGVKSKKIALIYNVCSTAIDYHLLPKEKRKELNRKIYQRSRERGHDQDPIVKEQVARSRKRKWEIQPEIREYQKLASKKKYIKKKARLKREEIKKTNMSVFSGISAKIMKKLKI